MYFCHCQQITKRKKSKESIFFQIYIHINQYQKRQIQPLPSLCSVSLSSSVSALSGEQSNVASVSSLIKGIVYFYFSSSSKHSLQRDITDILLKSRLPPSLSLSASVSNYLFLSFLLQPPVSASNIFSPHCCYTATLLS